ncbi:cytochrome c oxidase subunit II [Chachezhania antarctica]|uniref:cytochrome c oxidase subunit II n=1 Tax=Chachezhania antarctica TaxID=2340860 RepID=UPI000EAD96C3|nr:cytochrome c oxidase subunit II [Chachezhania antarctica]|tara:strand:- start:1405 stop:2265 length:861 start_codon:yes stop_codon:yes gene_type:complete
MKNALSLSGLLTALTALPAMAQDNLNNLEVLGVPVSGGTAFQTPATEIAIRQQWLEGMLMAIMIAITLFVVVLIGWIILRYNRKSNPTPSSFTHNTPLEMVWTLVPIVILVFIGAFSLPVLFYEQEIPKGDVTIKVTGNQWYWSYEYVDDDFGFDSYLLARDDLEKNGYKPEHYLLATDTAVVVPVGKTVVMQVTGSDVIHSWTIPAFGVKQDAVPGRLAELWFAAEKEGIYFGQCSELCGKDHAYMPITVKVVSEEAYEAWLKSAKEEYAGLGTTSSYDVAALAD